jgi:hypothetical protein
MALLSSALALTRNNDQPQSETKNSFSIIACCKPPIHSGKDGNWHGNPQPSEKKSS